MNTGEVVDIIYGDPMVWQLKIDGVNADLSAVTRWILYLKSKQGDIAIDTDDAGNSDVFDKTLGDGKVSIDLRLVDTPATIPTRKFSGKLVSFDPTNPDGVLWGSKPVTTIDTSS